MTNNEMQKVLVGVDGSSESTKALAWAEHYAERTNAQLTLVTAWHWPMSYGIPLAIDGWDPAVDAQRVIDKAMAEVSLPSEQVHGQIEEGPATLVLARLSRDAHLLVVGSRGHGTFAGAVLGSVSSHCMHHARCSVVVVR